ncbi:MAG: hypothetical protein LBT00_00590 [Spirochaetaceae bacterium]|nr:hypothetical protein [Spirochaetaceae bacterium]
MSLRAAKRRSNPAGEGFHPRLPRSARNDATRSAMCRLLAMTGNVVIASRKAAKQSSRGGLSP